jgi:putative ABC transport system permease protein
VVLTHEFWQSHLGSDGNVLDRSLILNGRPARIVGVMPADFHSPSELAIPDRPAIFVPAAYPADLLAAHGDHEVTVVGRLHPGVPVSEAQAELDAISAGLARQYPASNTGVRAVIAPLRDDLTRGARDSLRALLGASGLIVLIACLNVANLLLSARMPAGTNRACASRSAPGDSASPANSWRRACCSPPAAASAACCWARLSCGCCSRSRPATLPRSTMSLWTGASSPSAPP